MVKPGGKMQVLPPGWRLTLSARCRLPGTERELYLYVSFDSGCARGLALRGASSGRCALHQACCSKPCSTFTALMPISSTI